METSVKQYSFKGKSTIYTDEKRKNMQYNAKHDASVKAAVAEICEHADKYLPQVDKLYDLIVGEGLFRYYFVGQAYDPDRIRCRCCGGDITKVSGLYSWRVHPLEEPWKIECPLCHRRFPSNDFGSYYKLGLDQKGIFHPEKAKEEHIKLFGGLENVGYLKNDLYPEMDEHTDENGNLVNVGVHGWGVDDGFGYRTVNEKGELVTHTYIAYFLHEGLWHKSLRGLSDTGVIIKALEAFRDAYLYTDDIRYARAGAILLDRVADFYPDFDWYRWHENRGEDFRGKILDCIWENALADTFAECYDAFYPAYTDAELIAYLNAKAKAQGLENPKNSADLLRFNVEDGILRIIYRDAVDNKLAGNFGMDQRCVATAAVVLNTLPETKEWLVWMMAHGGIENRGPNPPKRKGGRVMSQLINVVDRDGMGNESSPGYNSLWVNSMLKIADVLHGYELYPEADLYQNPKFLKMLYAHLPIIMGGYYTAQIADTGWFAGKTYSIGIPLLCFAYMATKDPLFAQAMYLINGRTVKGLRYPADYLDPSSLETDVQQVIDTYGEFDMGSTMQAGYGLMALRDGKRTGEKNTIRDFWMYQGTTNGHGHRDTMNLGIDAFGLNLAPEIGYPKDTGPEAGRFQFVSATISHNTVTVDNQSQNRSENRGYPLHFDDSGKVKVMDAEKSLIYNETDLYRRTVVMVEANDDVSYGVDFFRVRGGSEHLYGFHAQSKEITETEGLHPVLQETGTYAGPDVTYGVDPSPLSGKSWEHNVYTYPDGYTWLEHVEKDLSPAPQVAVDFKITDFMQALDKEEDIHLRMTMPGIKPLDEFSIVDGYPVTNFPNPQTNIKFVLARNKADENGTLFTTVFEPYKGERYLCGIADASVVRADGKEIAADETVKAVKVTHTNGRVDYIVYALDNTVEYIVANTFRFRGFVGVVTYEQEKRTYTYLHDGDLLTDAICETAGAYTGTVAGFTKEFSRENTIIVTLEQTDAALSDITGRCIYIANDGEQNGVYEIKAAKALEDGTVVLDIGDTTLIRSFVDAEKPEKGYVYNIAVGQTFRIPRSFVR